MIILGKGQLGSAFVQQTSGVYVDLDISDEEAVLAYPWPQGEIVVNAAAYTDVDGSENNRKAAWRVNAAGPKYLITAALRAELTLVHISSDYVFDGTETSYSEQSELCPLGVYGQSKAAGDMAMQGKHYLIRTSWLIGQGHNFVQSILKARDPSVVCLNLGRPTFTDTLVSGIMHLLENNCEYGTYNLTNSGQPISWANFAREIYKAAGREDHVLNSFREKGAPRPRNSILELDKIEKTGFKPEDWKDALAKYLC